MALKVFFIGAFYKHVDVVLSTLQRPRTGFWLQNYKYFTFGIFLHQTVLNTTCVSVFLPELDDKLILRFQVTSHINTLDPGAHTQSAGSAGPLQRSLKPSLLKALSSDNSPLSTFS